MQHSRIVNYFISAFRKLISNAAEERRSRYVYLPHPAEEHEPSAGGVTGTMPWNTGTHRRKFVTVRGKYLQDRRSARADEGEIAFWCEWERESTWEKFDEHDGHGGPRPRFLHKPVVSSGNGTDSDDIALYRDRMNTDPYVFGDCFHYSCCRQYGEMKALEPGDVILFYGDVEDKARNERIHCLDTVFVVRERLTDPEVDYDEVEEELKANLGKIYYQTTILPLVAGLRECKEAGNEVRRFTLYAGATHDCPFVYRDICGKEHRMFSYVPCKAFNEQEGFARYELDDERLQQNNRQIVTGLDEKRSLAANYWDWAELTDDIVRRGFWLGVRADEP